MEGVAVIFVFGFGQVEPAHGGLGRGGVDKQPPGLARGWRDQIQPQRKNDRGAATAKLGILQTQFPAKGDNRIAHDMQKR